VGGRWSGRAAHSLAASSWAAGWLSSWADWLGMGCAWETAGFWGVSRLLDHPCGVRAGVGRQFSGSGGAAERLSG